jgi:hypothetical protein
MFRVARQSESVPASPVPVVWFGARLVFVALQITRLRLREKMKKAMRRMMTNQKTLIVS